MKYQESKTIMNSTFTISSYEKNCEGIIGEAFDLLNSFENKFTVFKDSFFNEINTSKSKSILYDEETSDIINLARKYYDLSNSKFNICYKSPKYTPHQIQIDKADNKISLPFEDMSVCLGGIGKGYAVDKAFNFLHDKGLRNFCVNGAGDLRVNSENAPRPWKIGLTNPFNTQNVIGHIALKNEAMATSGRYLRGEHIKLISSSEIISATVISPTTVEADIYATMALTSNAEYILSHFNELNIWACLVDHSGKVHITKNALKTHLGNTL